MSRSRIWLLSCEPLGANKIQVRNITDSPSQQFAVHSQQSGVHILNTLSKKSYFNRGVRLKLFEYGHSNVNWNKMGGQL